MKKTKRRVLALLLVMAMAVGMLPAAVLAAEIPHTGIAVSALKQTSSAYDLGIAADNVRLAWELDAEVRGVTQSAYHLVIRDDKETVYDTGWVESAAQSGIKAQNLKPETIYYWTVNVKDQYGNESGFAPEASFETVPETIGGAWIGTGKLLRKEFVLDQPLENVDRARSYLGSPSVMEIHLNGEKVGDLVLGPRKPVADTEVYYNTYDVLPQLNDGANTIGLMCSSVWAMGDSACGMLKIWYKDGSTQVISTDESWKVSTTSFVTRSTQSAGEDENANLMIGWDQPGYDTTGWSDAELVDAGPVYDGVYHVDENLGVYFMNATVSGNYSIEMDMTITATAGAIVFGSNSSMPWMWQFHGSMNALRIHDRGSWNCSKTVINEAISVNNPFHVKLEVVDSTVNTYINGDLIDTTAIAAGSANGNVGFRTAGSETFVVDNLKITQGDAVLAEDDFDSLDWELWNAKVHGKLEPSVSGTVVIDEIQPVNVYASPAGDVTVDKTKPYSEEGVLYLPDNCGMHYASKSFSGDYVVEMEARSDNVIALLFGNGSPFPSMWQFRGSSLRAHMPGGWSDVRASTIDGMNTKEFTKIKLEVKGNDVTVTVNDTLDGGTITLPAGRTSGRIGFRVAATESAEVNWIKVYQNGEVVLEDQFDGSSTTQWTFANQAVGKRYILDFGKNMSGYVRVAGQLAQGQTVKLAYSELVKEDGSLFPNTTLWYPTCTYTFSGGEDVFEPHFFYTGFRYVEVTSTSVLPEEMFTACFVSDDVPETGTFESSNDRLNAVYDMYWQAQRSNMVAIYTDCPQREKNGWAGDASATKEATSIILGDYTTAESYMRLMELSMYPTGQPYCIMPRLRSDAGLADEYDTTWASAYFTFPYYTYLQTGDPYYIEMMYDTLLKVFDFYQRQTGSDYIYNCTRYGDWLGYDNNYGKLERGSLTAVYTYASGVMLSEMAEVIGRDHSELDAYLAKMYDALQAAYNKGTYWAGNTQTNNSMALDFNLVPAEQKDAVVASTVKNLTDYGSLRTGVLGSLSLYNALSAENYHKELLDATITSEKCSFGYMLDNGATTMWELWDKVGESFHANVSDVVGEWESQNHCMFGGGVTSWMYEGLAGIRSTGPAYHTITYRPGLESGLASAKATVDTMIGLAASDWTYENGVLDWTFTVPVNAAAKVVIPMTDAMVIKEGGTNIFCKDGNGLTYAGMEDGAYVYTAGSGTYTIHASEELEGSVDASPIMAAITAANAAKEALTVNEDASEVEYGVKFVTKADVAALDDAITAAKIAIGDVQTEEDVTRTVNTLHAAVEVFEAAVQEGLLYRLTIRADNTAVPVAAQIQVNGEVAAERLPATVNALAGDVITSEAIVLNPVDFTAKNWAVNGEIVSDGPALNYTVVDGSEIVLLTEEISPENLALGKTVTATQAIDAMAPANLTNGGRSHLERGCWSSAYLGKGTTFGEHGPVIDLGEVTTFNRFHLYPRKDGPTRPVECFPVTYTFYVSDDNAAWTPVYSVQKGEVPANYKPVVVELEEDVSARYVKLGVTEINCADSANNAYVQLYELGIYNVERVDPNVEAAAAVDALIEAIDVEDKATIEAARAAYDALSDVAKALVTKYAVLEAAELHWNTVNNAVSLVLTGADSVNPVDGTAEYTLSAKGMHNLATLAIAVEIPGEYLSEPAVAPADGWMIVAQVWKDGILHVVAANNDGANGDGEILTITAKVLEKAGTATVAVTSAEMGAYLGEEETFVQADLSAASVTTVVEYNVYDVNKDGEVNLLDIARAQRYYGSYHADADVNRDGVVDIDDLIRILNNYTELFQ